MEDFYAYYDADTLIVLGIKFYCNNNQKEKCIYDDGIELKKFFVNQDFSESEFYIPETLKNLNRCEKNIELIDNLTLQINQLKEKLWIIQDLSEEERIDKETKEMRSFDEEEYLLFRNLKLELEKASCDNSRTLPFCNYEQYLQRMDELNLKCEF